MTQESNFHEFTLQLHYNTVYNIYRLDTTKISIIKEINKLRYIHMMEFYIVVKKKIGVSMNCSRKISKMYFHFQYETFKPRAKLKEF